MKLYMSLFFLLSLSTTIKSQISTYKVSPRQENVDTTPYDSAVNFLGNDVYKYIGQEFYVNGKPEVLREFGYEGFLKDYKISKFNNNNVYKCCQSYNSIYDSLVGRYFTVIEVIKHPKAEEDKLLYGSVYYLKLKDKKSGAQLYFQYDAQYEHKFPFIVVGFFQHLKNTSIGKEYVVRGKNWISNDPMIDLETGKQVSEFEPGKIWKCVDVTVEDKYYNLSLILENSKGEKIPLGVESRNNINWVFEKTIADYLQTKYGKENWLTILQGKVSIGMTTEMCELSWGSPEKINYTTTSYGKSEQWVYSDNYLYFEKGKLTAIQ